MSRNKQNEHEGSRKSDLHGGEELESLKTLNTVKVRSDFTVLVEHRASSHYI